MISIITISFNQGMYLPLAVESVLLQKGVDIDYIIVDAGSTDGSREYLRSLRDARVRLVFEEDEGPADGLNKGLRLVQGEVLGYLNADDVYVAGALAEAHELLTADHAVDVVYGDGWLIDGHGSVLRHYESTPWNVAAYSLGTVNVLQQATFFKRSAFELTSGFNRANRTCWDAELLIDLAIGGAHIAHVPRDWGVFRLHQGGITGSGRLQDVYKADMNRLATKVIGESIVPGGPTLRRYLARGWKLAAHPGYTFRRLRASAYGGARIALGEGGFRVEDLSSARGERRDGS